MLVQQAEHLLIVHVCDSKLMLDRTECLLFKLRHGPNPANRPILHRGDQWHSRHHFVSQFLVIVMPLSVLVRPCRAHLEWVIQVERACDE